MARKNPTKTLTNKWKTKFGLISSKRSLATPWRIICLKRMSHSPRRLFSRSVFSWLSHSKLFMRQGTTTMTKRPSRLNNKNSLISNKSKTRLPPNSWPKTVKKANVWSHSSTKSSNSNLMNNQIMTNSSSTSSRFFSTSIRHPIKSMTGMRYTWCKNQWRDPQTWRKRENRVIRLTQKCLTLKMLRTL